MVVVALGLSVVVVAPIVEVGVRACDDSAGGFTGSTLLAGDTVEVSRGELGVLE